MIENSQNYGPQFPPLPFQDDIELKSLGECPSTTNSISNAPTLIEPEMCSNLEFVDSKISLQALAEFESTRDEEAGVLEPSFSTFHSKWHEGIFICLLIISQMMTEYFMSGFAILAPQLISDLAISAYASTWPATAFSITLAGFIFIFGRLADIYGGYPVFLGGYVWFFGTSLVTGFSPNNLVLIIMRALQGLGPAALLPAGTKLLCAFYRPGARRTVVIGLYGSGAALGFLAGILVAGSTAQYLNWRWYFWFGSVCLFVMSAITCFALPKAPHPSRQYLSQMDWIGSLLISGGLALVVFGMSYNVHDKTPGKIALKVSTLLSGIAMLIISVFVESRVRVPLIPMTVIRQPKVVVLMLIQIFAYGSFGIFLFYSSLCFQNSWAVSPFEVALWYLPFVIGSIAIGSACKQLSHRFRGQHLLIVSGMGSVISACLLSFGGAETNYWTHVFPAMICASLGVDLSFDISSVHMIGWFEPEYHGFVGAWINNLFNISIALFLGLAGTMVDGAESSKGGYDYRPAFWLQLASAALALLIALLFSRLPKAPFG